MKLESLKEFQANSLNQAEMNSVLGGKEPKWIPTSKKRTDENGCVETTKDSFKDSNGNGVPDKGESATICVSIDCEN